MDQNTNGCFAFFRNMKESFIERWTRFRMKHKRDKIDTKYNNTYLHRLLARKNEEALLDTFITEVLISVKADMDSQIRNVELNLDRISMTSSVISQIADAVVTESLTSVIHDANQSADINRPKTLSEFMNTFGIANEPNGDGMPTVSD